MLRIAHLQPILMLHLLRDLPLLPDLAPLLVVGRKAVHLLILVQVGRVLAVRLLLLPFRNLCCVQVRALPARLCEAGRGVNVSPL